VIRIVDASAVSMVSAVSVPKLAMGWNPAMARTANPEAATNEVKKIGWPMV
jgi:hypothetical protein